VGFEWRAKIQNLAGPGVELPGNGVAFVLGEAGHRGMLWQVLADEAVGVLGGAALPGVIGLGEVEYDSGQALEPRVVMKRGAIGRLKTTNTITCRCHSNCRVGARRALPGHWNRTGCTSESPD
jgi:hypothetical protein